MSIDSMLKMSMYTLPCYKIDEQSKTATSISKMFPKLTLALKYSNSSTFPCLKLEN